MPIPQFHPDSYNGQTPRRTNITDHYSVCFWCGDSESHKGLTFVNFLRRLRVAVLRSIRMPGLAV